MATYMLIIMRFAPADLFRGKKISQVAEEIEALWSRTPVASNQAMPLDL